MPEWLNAYEITYFHRELIEEHGGLHGLRDEGALESALARPQSLLHYFPNTTIPALAACYGFGLTQNHAFVDGNKRIALAALNTFLQINGFALTASEVEAAHVIRELAAGNIDEAALRTWIETNCEAFDLDAS